MQNLHTWIYPTNYPIRGYQLNIVRKALFKNTLIALPTGLGKTFIAAAVLYNYYRWFPTSKIIFMAPKRPLVAQQMEACFKICGLSLDDTVEISGQTPPLQRQELWKTKRVFFSTPQTIQNDLKSGTRTAEKIVCVVGDEAHRVTGNYAYTDVIKMVAANLSATTGQSMDAVQNVVRNLRINNIQIRTEESMDVREFSHGKNAEKIVVSLDKEQESSSTCILPRIMEEFKTKVFQPMLTQSSKLPSALR